MDGVLSWGGPAVVEHPDDVGVPPYASIFATTQLHDVLSKHHGAKVTHDQCMSGCLTRKRTGLAGRAVGLELMAEQCCHGRHVFMPQYTDSGDFGTKGLETYPSEFCRKLACLFVNSYMQQCSGHSLNSHLAAVPPEVPAYSGVAGLMRDGRPRRGVATVASDVWPLRQSGRLPGQLAAARHGAAL